MQNEYQKIERNKILFQNLDNVVLYQVVIYWIIGFKPAHFMSVCCARHSVNRYSNAAINFTMSFCLFAFRRVWVEFHEHSNLMILLKPVCTFQFALNSDTVTDNGPKEVSAGISSLNIYLTLSFCKSCSCVGNGVQLHLFVTSTLDRSRWSIGHWSLDPQII